MTGRPAPGSSSLGSSVRPNAALTRTTWKEIAGDERARHHAPFDTAVDVAQLREDIREDVGLAPKGVSYCARAKRTRSSSDVRGRSTDII